MRYFKKDASQGLASITCLIDLEESISSDYIEITYTEYEAIQRDLTDLDFVKNICLREIDKAAGKIRSKYITSVPGQAETYMMKVSEAKEIKGLGYPSDINLSKYPLVQGEILATGDSLVVTCETIIGTEAMWRLKAAQIETERRKGKIAVSSLTTPTDVINIKNTTVNNLLSY